jgi:hypothetical protein
MAVTMMKAVFWDVAPCRYSVNRRFGDCFHQLHAGFPLVLLFDMYLRNSQRNTPVTIICVLVEVRIEDIKNSSLEH